MKRKRIPCPDKEILEQLLREHTLSEVAEMLGSHTNTVGTWKKKLGINVKRGATPIPEGFVSYCENHTRKETAEHFGLNYEMVRSMENRTGVKCAKRSYRILQRPEDLSVLLQYFTKKEVAERIGLSEQEIDLFIKQGEKHE